MRRLVKRVVEEGAARSGITRLVGRLRRNRVVILGYHNVVPASADAVPLGGGHIHEGEFSRQLEMITSECEVIPLSQALDAPTEGSDRPRVAITFDDGYLGAVTAGVRAVVQRGLPATVFVTPGMLGRRAFWWDSFPVDPWSNFSHFFQHLRGNEDRVREWAHSQGLPERRLGECQLSAHEAEVLEAASSPSITLGAHGWTHSNLAALEGHALEAELAEPLRWLQQKAPDQHLPVVAYPYGLTSPTVAARAEAAGYSAGLLITGGWIRGRRNPPAFLIPRLNIPAGISHAGFILRLGGLLE